MYFIHFDVTAMHSSTMHSTRLKLMVPEYLCICVRKDAASVLRTKFLHINFRTKGRIPSKQMNLLGSNLIYVIMESVHKYCSTSESKRLTCLPTTPRRLSA